MSCSFLISLHYLFPLSDIDKHRPAHIAFLQRYYDEGLFVCSGPKIPRTGGIIIARCSDKDALQSVIENDPFFIHGLAEYEVIEFSPTMASSELSIFLK